MIRRFTKDVPLSFESMVAQTMLRYGFRQDAEVPGWQVRIRASEGSWELLLRAPDGTQHRAAGLADRMAAGRALQNFLTAETGQSLGAWGYLNGMRPSKLLQRFFGQPDWNTRAEALLTDLRVAPELRRLLLDIADVQARFVPAQTSEIGGRTIVYMGIPYCPSHCLYCSFPTRVARPQENWEPFLAALCRDVEAAGELLQSTGRTVEAFYYGGGTPTVLPARELARLLATVRSALPLTPATEYTVEAGRPDTLTEEKLHVLRAAGVNRLSINPQTLQDRLLRRVGRTHTTEEVYRMYETATELGFSVINMDFIAGLPGQTAADMAENLAAVCRLRPANVTVHTLALKRGSPLAGQESTDLPGETATYAMVRAAATTLRAAGYLPYYLYRQKYLQADLPNLGYALPGTACLYNMQMMAERLPVLGIGPGATNKVIRNEAFQLTRCYFPRDPDRYRTELAAWLVKREELFEAMTKERTI
ncbi:MAG: coproporphyrinogen dehydrogenase HemZ [Veillonellaceae bacterium]|nr:coproporphyrinogen dehydrogenase HemZ [Veillonellaceae bacterium]